MIDITKFFLISKTQFEQILMVLNIPLTQEDPVFMVTLLFANFLAYYIIYLFIKIVVFTLKTLFKPFRI